MKTKSCIEQIRNIFLIILSYLIFCFAGMAETYTEEIELPIGFGDIYSISIENQNGNIEVIAWDKWEMFVKVTKRIDLGQVAEGVSRPTTEGEARHYSELIEIQHKKKGDQISFKTKLPDIPVAVKVDYQVSVFADVALRIRNDAGNVLVKGINGAVDIGLANGDVELSEVIGKFQVTVVRGAVTGEILLNGKSEFSLNDGSINIDILDTLTFPLTAEATNIRIRLPHEYSASLEAEAQNGKVSCGIPLTLRKQASEVAEAPGILATSVLRGWLNDGGDKIKLKSLDGDIDIQSLSNSEEQEEPTEVFVLELEEMPLPNTDVPKTESAPKIDGSLKERVWRKAARLEGFYVADGSEPAYEFTEAYLLWDENNFYIGVKVYDSQMSDIEISQTAQDSAIWEDDSIEILLKPEPDNPRYYHIAVNPIGAIFDQRVYGEHKPDSLGSAIQRIRRGKMKVFSAVDPTWNSNCIARTDINSGFWAIEMSIPHESIGVVAPQSGDEWRFNLHRKEQRLNEYSYWSPTYVPQKHATWPHFPERFGELHFVEFVQPEEATLKLAKIEISGNKLVTDDEIREVIGYKEGDAFAPASVFEMRRWLEESGWFKSVNLTLESNDILTIKVIEDSLNMVKSVEIHGNAFFSNEQLIDYFNLKPLGRVAEGVSRLAKIVTDNIATKCSLMAKLYHNENYPLASVTHEISNGKLIITVDEGRLDKIEIVGNRQIERSKILKYLGLSPGDVYNSDSGEVYIATLAAKLKEKHVFFKRIKRWSANSKNGENILVIEIEEQPIVHSTPRSVIGFNRIHGLKLGGGAEFSTDYAHGGRLYGVIYYGLSSKTINYQLGAEKGWFDKHQFMIGAEVHKLTDTNDFVLLPPEEDFLTKVFLGKEFEDYFQREGYKATLRYKLTPSTSLSICYDDDEYSNLFKNSDWSPFDFSTPKRSNPRINPGRIHNINIAYEFDSRNVKKSAVRNFRRYPIPTGQTTYGWQGYFSLEYAGRRIGGDFDFTLYRFSITRYNRLSRNQTFDFRLSGGFSDSFLPAQRTLYIGGVGTLRGYDFKEFMGDNMLLLNVEYRLKLENIVTLYLVAFCDWGYTWEHKQKINLENSHTAVGIGAQLGDNVRIDLAQPLDKNRDMAFLLRLNRMF